MPHALHSLWFYAKLNAFVLAEFAVGALLLCVFVAASLRWRWVDGLVAGLRRCARDRLLAASVPVVLMLAGRMALLPVLGVPYPGMARDEFSHLLAADTFTSGRLTNPTHPYWRHFESPHVIQRPSYASKYPPGQGLVLALGQALGDPWIGVVLSMAALVMATGWALRAWIPAEYAFMGALLLALRLGISSYWMNSYFGGAVAALGGTLVLGALPRIFRGVASGGIALGLGFGLLVYTRPLEGFLTAAALCIAAAFAIGRLPRKRLHSVVAPSLTAAAILAVFLGWLAFYQWRVTGHPFRMPYQVWREQYSDSPYWLWQRTPEARQFDHERLQAYASWERRELSMNLDPVVRVQNVIRIMASFYWGPLLFLLVAVSVPRLFGRNRIRPVVLAVVGAAAAMNVTSPYFRYPHYPAPLTAGLLVIAVHSARLWRIRLTGLLGKWSRSRRVAGRAAWAGVVSLAATIVVMMPVGMALANSHRNWILPTKGSGWCCTANIKARNEVERRIQAVPGRHLVLVSYVPGARPGMEWVYNGASIDDARIVWAHTRTPDEDAKLVRYFQGRTVWFAEIGPTDVAMRKR